MKKYIFLIFMLTQGVMISPAWSLAISHVFAGSNQLNIDADDKLELIYRVDQPANVELLIYDARDILVRKYRAVTVAAGENQLSWDGRDQAGNAVPPEAYYYVLKAHSKTGQQTEYDLTDHTGGEQLVIKHFIWDKNKQQIELLLTAAARVVIRAGIKNNGPLLKTIVDWGVLPAGKHRIDWDGKGESGVLTIGAHPNLQLAKDAYTLPDNVIIVQSDRQQPAYISELSWPKQMREKKLITKTRMYAPSQLAADKRGDFAMQLAIGGDVDKNSDGLPLVHGKVPVRLMVDSEHLNTMASQRFEPVFYVDGQFVFENETGFFPMTFLWDSGKVNPGVHYITANLRGDRSNFGMATIKVEVRK